MRLGTARRILPEAAPAQCGGRRIGSAIVLLPLLACCSLLLPALTLARRTRWVLGILSLLAGAVLLQTAPAQAQARSVNVSNINQTSTDQSFAGATLCCIATAFTTGGAGTGRYTLNTVVVAFGSGNTGSPTAAITNPGTGSNSINPGTLIANLNGTVPSGGGNVTFTAPNGTTLNGGATYFLDVCASLGNTTVHKVTTSDAQESTSTTGWSIANEGRRGTSGTYSALADSKVLVFTVNATLNFSLTPSNITTRGARLTLGGHTGAW